MCMNTSAQPSLLHRLGIRASSFAMGDSKNTIHGTDVESPRDGGDNPALDVGETPAPAVRNHATASGEAQSLTSESATEHHYVDSLKTTDATTEHTYLEGPQHPPGTGPDQDGPSTTPGSTDLDESKPPPYSVCDEIQHSYPPGGVKIASHSYLPPNAGPVAYPPNSVSYSPAAHPAPNKGVYPVTGHFQQQTISEEMRFEVQTVQPRATPYPDMHVRVNAPIHGPAAESGASTLIVTLFCACCCTGLLFGIPAIIFATMAYATDDQDKYRLYKRLAWLCNIIGFVVFIVVMIALYQ